MVQSANQFNDKTKVVALRHWRWHPSMIGVKGLEPVALYTDDR
jgi:hypothetical protein